MGAMMKRVLKLFSMLTLCFSLLVVFTACDKYEFPYLDMIERPSDIPPLAELEYVKYPEKPANLTVGQGQGMPNIGTPSTTSENYKIEQADGKITVKFTEVGKWDYVYIPLGGNRVSKLKWIRNLFIVWFLTGFWHGASWNFIIWGLYFGIILVIEKLFVLL